MDLKLGENYKIGKKLGAGEFEEVYLARDSNTGKEVAVKIEDNRSRHLQLIYNTHLEKNASARAN